MTSGKKPVYENFNPPDNQVEPPEEPIRTGGFIDGLHYIYGKVYNYFFRLLNRVADYVLGDVRAFYVCQDTGDDDAGDGSEGSPFETIAKAIDEAGKWFTTRIFLMSEGTYLISNDIEYENKKIHIDSRTNHETLQDITIQAETYFSPGLDKTFPYSIKVKGSFSELKIWTKNIHIGTPTAEKDWGIDASFIKVYSNNHVQLIAEELGLTASATGGACSIVQNAYEWGWGTVFLRLGLTTAGSIKLGDNGHVLDVKQESLATLQCDGGNGTIDDATGLRWVRNGVTMEGIPNSNVFTNVSHIYYPPL